MEGQGLACWWCWCGGAGSLATPRTVPWSLQLSLGPTGKPSGKLEPLSSSEQWLVTQIQEDSDNQKKLFLDLKTAPNARELLRVQEALMGTGKVLIPAVHGHCCNSGPAAMENPMEMTGAIQERNTESISVCRGPNQWANYF